MWQTCKKCNIEMIGIEYAFGPNSYDGISEFKCEKCGLRVGRWSLKELNVGEEEKKYGRDNNN